MPLNDDDRAALSAYLDGELDEGQTQRVEARISLEPEVRAEYEAMRRAWGLLDYLPRAAPSASFTHRTLERISLEKRAAPRSAWWRRLSHVLPWAAAVLVAAGLGVALGGLLPPLPTAPPADPDEALVRHLRVIEKWPLYQHADDLDFIRQLDQPELFGDEPGS
jgi:anti-sigma factor RsiW